MGRPRREARGQAAIRGRRRVLRIMKADGCADGLRAWRSVYSRLSVWSRKSGTSRERKARRTRSRRLRNEAHTRIKSYELVSYRSVSLTMASHEPLSKRLHVVATGDLFISLPLKTPTSRVDALRYMYYRCYQLAAGAYILQTYTTSSFSNLIPFKHTHI